MADTHSNAGLSAYPLPEGAPRAGVIHVRHPHTDRFTVVGNHLAQHPDLSAVAIGLAVHILSLPDGASVTVKALTLRFREGETTVRRALNELVAAGYLERRRVPLGGGRFATRTFAYDRPGHGTTDPPPDRPAGPGGGRARPTNAPAAPVPLRRRTPTASARPATTLAHSHPVPVSGPAADILARLRLADPRLLLSARDVLALAPAVDTWLARAATPAQIVRTLTANLPPQQVPIHHPARFLEYRLTTHLPPPLPATPRAMAADRPPPLITCDGCDRAIRSHDPTAHCADCRTGDRAG
ncbi:MULTISPECIES: hypothetical protein [unclassified Streptomyces]|uniref:hypothetical protein n=1 Tax=unclassified Streptomyces TaxID=2593676 RepID=UPI002E28C047|nr:hypothetical protein [Streptomyces sp. NBC_00223]